MTSASFSADSDPGPATPPRAPNHRRWRVLAARLILAGIFIYASLDKIAHPAAFADDVYNYQILPDALINLTALVLPWLELFLGLCLLTGIWLSGAVLAANGLLVAFLAALGFNLARGLDINCGCFSTGSVAPAMSAGWYLLRDMGFFAVGIFLFHALFLHHWRERPQSPSARKHDIEKGEMVR
jgi:uncharacterized membrane protein YphA (DoxX/SURF4 family)